MKLTHRKRILAAVNHQPLDHIPTDMWATPEIQEILLEHFGITAGRGKTSQWIGLNGGVLSRGIEGIIELWDRLEIDGIFDVHPPYIGPKKEQENTYHFNEWGFGYRRKSYGEGEYDEQIFFPLEHFDSANELEQYQWPDPDWYDYSKLPDIIKQCGDRAVNCGYSAVFTYHNYLRGMEKSFMDPLVNPELCKNIIYKLSDFFNEYHRRCFEAAGEMIDFTQVTDDWGGQAGLMTSPQIFADFYKAPMKRAIELAQAYDIKIFHHDDGDIRQLLPDLVEMGIDILNPVQWNCGGWNLKQLKEQYGDRICFHSAVNNQETLPHGTADDVKTEVKTLIDILASDGTGFILGPCHNLQPNTTIENILALYEAAAEFGRF